MYGHLKLCMELAACMLHCMCGGWCVAGWRGGGAHWVPCCICKGLEEVPPLTPPPTLDPLALPLVACGGAEHGLHISTQRTSHTHPQAHPPHAPPPLPCPSSNPPTPAGRGFI